MQRSRLQGVGSSKDTPALQCNDYAMPAVSCAMCRVPCAAPVQSFCVCAQDKGAARKAQVRQLLCEQDPDAPGLTLEQRRKIRR